MLNKGKQEAGPYFNAPPHPGHALN